MKVIFIWFSWIAGAVLITACSKTKSDNVKTSGFYASLSVGGNNSNSVHCSASFQVGGPTGTYLDLSGGDTVTCNGNSMVRSEFAGIITYSADVSYLAGGNYTITLNRSGENPYSSTVTLPSIIVGMSPTSGTFTKGQALNVNWTPSANPAEALEVQLNPLNSSWPNPCPPSNSQTDTSPENGSLGFSGTEMTPSPMWTGNCSLQVKWIRYRYGTMATGLDGAISGTQTTTGNLTLID